MKIFVDIVVDAFVDCLLALIYNIFFLLIIYLTIQSFINSYFCKNITISFLFVLNNWIIFSIFSRKKMQKLNIIKKSHKIQSRSNIIYLFNFSISRVTILSSISISQNFVFSNFFIYDNVFLFNFVYIVVLISSIKIDIETKQERSRVHNFFILLSFMSNSRHIFLFETFFVNETKNHISRFETFFVNEAKNHIFRFKTFFFLAKKKIYFFFEAFFVSKKKAFDRLRSYRKFLLIRDLTRKKLST